jgi:chlorobactene glucosyltransferase
MRILMWIVLVAWILTFFRTLLNLLSVEHLPLDASDDGPLVSVIIPARDEEKNIERTVVAFLSQTYRNFELIVVDDRSSDSTGSILQRMAAIDARLKVIHGEEPPEGWLGKPWALHQGSRRASGEILVFADADIIYSPRAIARAVAAMQRSGVPMITLLPNFEMDTFWEKVAIPQLAVMVFSFSPMWLANRTRIVLFSIGGGSGNLIRREDYDAIGGHEALKDAVVDDIGLARLVRRQGRRSVAFRADDAVFVHMYHGVREIIRGFTKNLFAVLGRSYFWIIVVTVFGIIFHVLPYILALTGDPIALATVAIITATRVMLFRSLRYPLSYALLAHPLMVLFWSYIFLRSMWLTGVRKRLVWRGRSYDAARTRFGA